jgi:hypothetical protein
VVNRALAKGLDAEGVMRYISMSQIPLSKPAAIALKPHLNHEQWGPSLLQMLVKVLHDDEEVLDLVLAGLSNDEKYRNFMLIGGHELDSPKWVTIRAEQLKRYKALDPRQKSSYLGMMRYHPWPVRKALFDDALKDKKLVANAFIALSDRPPAEVEPYLRFALESLTSSRVSPWTMMFFVKYPNYRFDWFSDAVKKSIQDAEKMAKESPRMLDRW